MPADRPGEAPAAIAGLRGVTVGPEVLDEALRAVIDPELGVNIVDLGLVYDAAVVDGRAEILITTTTPA